MMSTARLTAAIAATQLISPAVMAQPDQPAAVRAAKNDCRVILGNAIRSSGTVPTRCWQIGPIILGMPESEVQQRLGTPDQRITTSNGVATLYVFNKKPGPLVTGGRARFRIVELRYADNQLIAIDTNPGMTMFSPACPAHHRIPTWKVVDTTEIAGPLLTFSGMQIGDPLLRLVQTFGSMPNRNRSGDWYNYLPVPVSFDVDPDRKRITGIAIARDESILTGERPQVHLRLERDPTTCGLTGIKFTLQGEPYN